MWEKAGTGSRYCVLSTEDPVGGSPQGWTHGGDNFHVIFLFFVSLLLKTQVFLFNFFKNIVQGFFFYSWKFIGKSGRGQRNWKWGWPLPWHCAARSTFSGWKDVLKLTVPG